MTTLVKKTKVTLSQRRQEREKVREIYRVRESVGVGSEKENTCTGSTNGG